MSAGVACFVQTCDQVITGRQFAYDRALSIIQEEEYLEDLDFDDIKRQDILKKFNTNFNIPENRQYSNWAPAKNEENKKHHGKNTWAAEKSNISPTKKNQNLNKVASSHNGFAPPGQKGSSRKKRFIFPGIPATASDGFVFPAIPSEVIEPVSLVQDGAPTAGVGSVGFGALGALGAGTIGMGMMMPSLNFQSGGSTPAGTLGGGGLPTDPNIATAAFALALVPIGLAAVAIFPPFLTPRTLPAVAVIFSEARDLRPTIKKKDIRNIFRMIKKRSPAPILDSDFWNKNTKIGLPSYKEIKHAVKNTKSNTIDIVTKAWNSLSRFRIFIAKSMYKKLPRRFKSIVKKFGRIEAHFYKKLVCLQPRIKRKYGKLVYPNGLTIKAIKEKKKKFEDFVKFENADDANVEYIEDCFDDLERPRFGWRVKVRTTDDEPCDVNFENSNLPTCNSFSDSNNETDSKHYAQSRQTGEGFRSTATPDCRTYYVCDTPIVTNRRSDIIQDQSAELQSVPAQLYANARVGDQIQQESNLFTPVSLELNPAKDNPIPQDQWASST